MEKYQIDKIKQVQISISKKEEILSASHGEVSKPETINYKTYKPEKNGLFDEKIFGPTKDYRCPVCGKRHKRADHGKPCSNCGEAIIYPKSVRRRHMGHINLYSPVANIWFSRIDYSIIGALLELKQDELESLVYFKAHIIYDNGGLKNVKVGQILNIKKAPSIYRSILQGLLKEYKNDKEVKKEISEKIAYLVDSSQSEIERTYGIDFHDYNEFISSFSDIKIGTGAEVIKILLKNINLLEERKKLLERIKGKTQNNSLLRRLKIIESFLTSKQDPSEMIMDVLPVIPADLRPLIQLDGGRHSTVDINELYRRVIIRNNRLKQWLDMEAPMLIVQNEKRMLQEAVDALIDNSRKKTPVLSKDNRPLKSLAENLKGKQGRFRQNLLGKRVDYSGRSVIVVGPELKLHQVGLPKEMVVKLFEPFIVNLLVKENVVKNIKQAKKLIEVLDDRIWKYASRVIKSHPVMLNRAPTLHRLSIQAFEPIIVSGKAIRLHPLVTPSFNADFDGDQMAVHVPISKKAKEEATNLMLSNKNILGAKDGKLILSPSQDIILGLYYMTKYRVASDDYVRVYGTYDEIINAYELDLIHLHDLIVIPLSMFESKFEHDINDGYKYLVTTVGRVIVNNSLPEKFPYINTITEDSLKVIPQKFLLKQASELAELKPSLQEDFKPFKKSQISILIESIFENNPEEISETLDKIKFLGFENSMISGTSMAISDILEVEDRESIISKGDQKVKQLWDSYEEGLLTDDQRYLKVLDVWSQVKGDIQTELQAKFNQNPDNSLFMMMDSGARSNITNIVQLAGLRGSMSKATHEYAALKRQNILVRNTEEIPIKSSFKTGLNPFEYFLSTHGARKGLSDTATKTAESGYLTRRLVDAVQDISIVEDDCHTNKGFKVEAIKDTRTGAVIETLFDRIVGRNSLETLKDETGAIIVEANQMITKPIAKRIVKANHESVVIRSALTCNSSHGVCKKCYGVDLTSNKEVSKGEAVGIISAQSIGEPGTQLTMRTFHTGGVAGVSDITQGFARLMELVDANKNPKSPAIISRVAGVVTEINERENNIKEVVVESDLETNTYEVQRYQTIRAKVGDELKPGQKITEGSIQLQQLLKYGGTRRTQSYLIKEIQRLYRLQGIEITDKYIEIIIKQMLSKIQIVDPGDTELYIGQIVSADRIRKINAKAFANGQNPAYGTQVIYGVKPLPLQSESFLAAASYQRTSEALVNAAIIKKTDHLRGIKENLILGKQIPVGTGMTKLVEKFDFFVEDIEKEFAPNLKNFDFKKPHAFDQNDEADEIRIVNAPKKFNF